MTRSMSVPNVPALSLPPLSGPISRSAPSSRIGTPSSTSTPWRDSATPRRVSAPRPVFHGKDVAPVRELSVMQRSARDSDLMSDVRLLELSLPPSMKAGLVMQPKKPLDIPILRTQIKSGYMPRQYQAPPAMASSLKRGNTALPPLPHSAAALLWQRGGRAVLADLKRPTAVRKPMVMQPMVC